MNNNQSFRQFTSRFFNPTSFAFVSTLGIWTPAQTVFAAPSSAQRADSFNGWYILLLVLVVGLAGAIIWRINDKKAQKKAPVKPNQPAGGDKNLTSLDADKELQWLRKNQKLMRDKRRQSSVPRNHSSVEAQSVKRAKPETVPLEKVTEGIEVNSVNLPIFSIDRLEKARPFDDLPISDDEDLMSAVEQGHDEFEEDEEVRELAVRVLAAFKTRNSVETLSQIALYDLSSSLRSKAISVLSEFDHESVFETILLANADPTREVRAAAARGMSKLTFDRADAWTRIAETGEEGRIVQTARAAIESGFVDMSFDRLVHPDHKHAYEAFTLMALLLKAGETEKIFNALENHRDMKVRRAILHIIKVTKEEKALEALYRMLEKSDLPQKLHEEIAKTIEEVGFVAL